MEITPAKRISSIKPYFFADLQKAINQLEKAGVDIIRLDMGSPDLPPADFIIDALIDSARQPNMHGYGQSGGSDTHRSAFANYYFERFNTHLDPEKEVVGLIGSKEGLFNLSQVLINANDLVLVPDPCYPVYAIGASIAQAKTFSMPLLAENEFLPNLDDIPRDIARKAKIMWLNYPNNPTGAVAPLNFFEEVIEFAKRYKIIVAHDAPYVDVCFDNYEAPSIFQVSGAKDVAVEFNSVSKTYNMAGWRVGMAVGNSEIIRLLRVYKSQLDSSHFKPIMKAADVALTGDQSWIMKRNAIYQKRRDIIVQTLRGLGFSLEVPKASLYIWAKLPAGNQDSIAFCEKLLQETGVSVTPGIVYGKSGKGYIRISLVTPVERLSEAMERMAIWMRETI
jgi:LL-diaminopimelate aminotransferase